MITKDGKITIARDIEEARRNFWNGTSTKSAFEAHQKKMVQWTQWENGKVIRCGQTEYKTVMEWMRERGAEARECMKRQERPHALYGMVMHDDGGIIKEVRFFTEAYLTDFQLEYLPIMFPNATIYAAHK